MSVDYRRIIRQQNCIRTHKGRININKNNGGGLRVQSNMIWDSKQEAKISFLLCVIPSDSSSVGTLAISGPSGSKRTRCSTAAWAALSNSEKNRCLRNASSSRPMGVVGGSIMPPSSLSVTPEARERRKKREEFRFSFKERHNAKQHYA